jgi:hypothetical protein
MPVSPIRGVAKGNDDDVADARRDLLIAAGAAIGLVGGKGLDPAHFG